MEKTMIAAMRAAGDELMKYFGQTLDFTVKESQSSIVTQADMKSDALVSSLIRDAFPAHNIISEESGFSNRSSNYTWVIDPLDGTSNFAAGIPWFGVLIALFENNIPVMGGAYLPASGKIYTAQKGGGAFLDGKPLVMKKTDGLKNSLCSFNVDFTDNERVLNESIEIYKNLVRSARNIRCTNSLVDFLYTAEGNFGAVINLFTRVWDIAGLGLIIEEAGGKMKYADGSDIVFHLDDRISGANFPVMAGSEEILAELSAKVIA